MQENKSACFFLNTAGTLCFNRPSCHDGHRPAMILQEDESIPAQEWNSLQGGQVHYTDSAGCRASNDPGRAVFSSPVYRYFFFLHCSLADATDIC